MSETLALQEPPISGRARTNGRRSRADQLESNRAALIEAAAKVVGEVGYSKASVVKITSLAGLGQGTFYTYFDSRQELFDILLPELGQDMLRHVRERVSEGMHVLEVEELSYRAFAEYVLAHPWFGTILFEAETMAPTASRQHAHRVVSRHIGRLERAWERGELPGYRREEMPTLSSVLLALRRHFARTRIASYQPVLPAEDVMDMSIRVIRRMLAT